MGGSRAFPEKVDVFKLAELLRECAPVIGRAAELLTENLEAHREVLEAGEVWKREAEKLKAYARAESPANALEKVPVARGLGAKLQKAMRSAVRARLEGHPAKKLLEPVLLGRVVADFRREFRCESVDRVPAARFEEALDWLAAYDFGSALCRSELAGALLEARAALGLSQAGAAELLGVPFSTYVKWERGRRAPGKPNAWKVAEFLRGGAAPQAAAEREACR